MRIISVHSFFFHASIFSQVHLDFCHLHIITEYICKHTNTTSCRKLNSEYFFSKKNSFLAAIELKLHLVQDPKTLKK